LTMSVRWRSGERGSTVTMPTR